MFYTIFQSFKVYWTLIFVFTYIALKYVEKNIDRFEEQLLCMSKLHKQNNYAA